MKVLNIKYQSCNIFYRITGEGKPVVLLHGFGEDGNIWDKQVEFLKENLPPGQADFQLIIPDLPGSGNSDMIPDMSIDGMAEAIKAILDKEEISECVLLGHSMGGYITLAFAEKYPQQLSSFGLIHSSAFADGKEKKAARLKSIEFINKHGAYAFLRTTIPTLFSNQWSKDHPQEIEELVQKSKRFTADALVQYYRAMISRPDRTSVLKNFSKPILFIIGEQDNAVPFEQSLQQCYLPVQSHIHILRNSAHMGMWEETDAVNNFLLVFLQ